MGSMVGICAVGAGFGRDLDACFAQVERLLAAARRRGADLVVLPESALGGYLLEPGPGLPPALAPDGPEIARLVALAGDTVVCAGYTERGDAGAIHASAVCVGGGEVLGRQRKVHLPPAERFAYTAGDALAAFDTPVGRIGMQLCYDKLFPETTRALCDDGAELIACLAAWGVDRHRPAARVADDRQTRHFVTVAQARAIENQVTWVSSNQTGRWGALRFAGHAQVVDPDGVPRAATGARAGLAVAQLDPGAERDRVRATIDHLADRRPSAYTASAVMATAATG
jgi:N-carbamoylputrescine amidase